MCSPTRIILNPNGLKRGNDGYKNDGYLKNDLNTNFQKVDLKRLYYMEENCRKWLEHVR